MGSKKILIFFILLFRANSVENSVDSKIRENEGGIKGFGPLQLLNYAFKKGAIKEALKESEVIKATHAKMEQEMEDAFGIADHNVFLIKNKLILLIKSKKFKLKIFWQILI